MKGKAKMYTIKEAAEIIGASPSSIRVWLTKDSERVSRFPNAVKQDSPIGSFWLIPEIDLKGYESRKLGRPFKPDSELKAKRRKVKSA
jgi:hypothetical protein